MSYMSAILENKEKISAGGEVLPAAISYLTITSKVVSMSSYEKDENKIKKKIIETLKNRGIYIKDVEVLDQMDRNYKDASKSYIDVGAKISPKKSLEEEAFLLECKNIQETLMKISEDITLGIVKIAPKKINKKLPCEYCAYKNMCRKTIRG